MIATRWIARAATCWCTLAGTFLLCAVAGPAGIEHGATTLVLDNAVGGKTPLTLHIRSRNGKLTQYWATTPGNNTAHTLDVSGLRVSADRLEGVLTSAVGRVQYSVEAEVRADGVSLSGAYRGKYGVTSATGVTGVISGAASPRVRKDRPVAFDLRLSGGVPGMTGPIAQVLLAFTMRNGKAEAPAVASTTGRQPSPHWTGQVDRIEVSFDGDTVNGEAGVTIEPTAFLWGGGGEFVFTFNGRLYGNTIVGRFKTQKGGKQVGDSFLLGTARSMDADGTVPDALSYALVFSNAVDGQASLVVHMDRKDGVLGPGIAFTEKLGEATGRSHGIDTSSLKFDGDRLRGVVDIKVDPDGWSHAPFRPVSYRCSVEAVVAGGSVTGAYSGAYITPEISGAITGRVESWESIAEANRLANGRDYPRWRGPDGSGASVSCGRELVKSLDEARLLWRSEAATPDSWYWKADPMGGQVGGYGGPLVADGRVYLFFYLPSGTNVVGSMKDRDLRDCERWEGKYRIDADDVMLCVDAATGRTLWRTVFKEKGINFALTRSGPFMTPCVADGRIYGIGSAGRVYCLDAAAGTVVWESTLGPAADAIEAMRQECRGKGKMPGPNSDFCGAPLVAGGVLVCNDDRGGLIGLDLRTGVKKWGTDTNRTAKTTSPALWKRGDRDYVLVGAPKVTCVDPATGAVVWEQHGAVAQATIAVFGDFMVCGGGETRGVDGVKKSTGLSAYRLSEKGATLLWDLGAKYGNHVVTPLILNRHVYAFWEPATLCVELETGKIVGSAEFPGTRGCSSMIGGDGRVIREHLYQRWYYYDADPKSFRQLGAPWYPPSHAECTTSAIVDGRLFLRARDALFAYDLRVRSEER